MGVMMEKVVAGLVVLGGGVLAGLSWFGGDGTGRAAEPATAPAAKNASDGYDRLTGPYFAKYCLSCHGPEKQKGDLRLDTLSRDFLAGASNMKWQEIIERVNTKEMPPPEAKAQPSAEESAQVVQWITDRLKEGEAARLGQRGRVAFYKLTRGEYANTIRDLLGVQFDANDPTGLTEDPDWNGFQRLGSVLSLAPSHVEKYLAAAETILAEAFPTYRIVPPADTVGKGAKPRPRPKEGASTIEQIRIRRDAFQLRGNPADREALAPEFARRVRVEMWPGHELQGGRAGPGVALPAAGWYRIRIQLSGVMPPDGRAPHLVYYCSSLDRMLHEQDVIAPEDQPTIIEFLAHLPAGNHSFRLGNDVPGPSVLPRSGRPGKKYFTSFKDGREPWQLKLTDEDGLPLWPVLILDWLEWEGPIVDGEQTYAQREYLPTNFDDESEVRGRLRKFAERAFRRPVSPAEVERYLKLMASERQQGETPLSAFKAALQAILCAKDFLYIVEGSPDRPDGRLTDWELASRLSYFLWGSMPDDTLLGLARSGTLSQPEVLREQLQRMLRDPKAKAFVQDFPRQWLQLHKVGMFPPDKKIYPDYDAHLEKSMIAETVSFFQEVLEKNLSLREFLDSDWTMANARLAEHYGLPRIVGDAMRRVALKPEHHRGGILTQAATLSLTSDGTRHRPVHRGKWLLESILGRSVPPPPANVKPIEPTPATEPKATVRMKLEAHKSDAACAACHRRIDPLGLAFDNYDAIGRWRTVEIVPDGQGDHPPVDASGTLPDGRAFADAQGFKKLLLEDLDSFNAAFVEKLAVFALRRTMTVSDRDRLAAIAQASQAADYRLPAIIEALVTSELFRHR